MHKRLIELRQKHNLTQEDVANFLEVARTTYANYEQNKREMDYESLLKLRARYEVSLDYLFGLTDNPFMLEDYSKDEIEFVNRTLEVYRSVKNKY